MGSLKSQVLAIDNEEMKKPEEMFSDVWFSFGLFPPKVATGLFDELV